MTSSPPSCSNHPCDTDCVSPNNFNFLSLQKITESIYNLCTKNGAKDPRLATWSNGTIMNPPALTAKACVTIAQHRLWPTWYPASAVWQRLTTWKFPLIQLAAQFPRPPLGKRVELFVFLHLLGNPIGTLQDILVKFASCQGRALFWKHEFLTKFRDFATDDDYDDTPFAKFERHWKAFAIIIDSCDEWGLDDGDYTSRVLQDLLTQFKKLEENPDADQNAQAVRQLRRQFVKSCLRTGKALAADRGTKLFPVTVAMILFVLAIIVAFIRTHAAGEDNPSVFVNIEAYSIAFSASFFWILPITVLGAAIGSSQTETAIPRILKRLERETNALLGIRDEKDVRWIEVVRKEINERVASTKSWQRKRDGGIYSWQHAKWSISFGHPSEQVKRIRYDVSENQRKLGVQRLFPLYPSRPPLKPFGSNRPVTPSASTFRIRWSHVAPVAHWFVDKVYLALFWVFRLVYWIHRPFLPLIPGSPVFPAWVVFLGLLTGWIIGFRIPGERYSCRFVGEAVFFVLWLFSWSVDFLELATIAKLIPEASTRPGQGPLRRMSWGVRSRFDNYILKVLRDENNRNSVLFYSQGGKDLFIVLAFLVWIIITQKGVLNSCNCYTLWSTRYLILPTSPDVAQTLYNRIWKVYFVITFISIVYMLVAIPITVAGQYFDAWQVFIQRDDKTSNLECFQKERAAKSVWNNAPAIPAPSIQQHGEENLVGNDNSGHIQRSVKLGVDELSQQYAAETQSTMQRDSGIGEDGRTRLAVDEDENARISYPPATYRPGGVALPASRPRTELYQNNPDIPFAGTSQERHFDDEVRQDQSTSLSTEPEEYDQGQVASTAEDGTARTSSYERDEQFSRLFQRNR